MMVLVVDDDAAVAERPYAAGAGQPFV